MKIEISLDFRKLAEKPDRDTAEGSRLIGIIKSSLKPVDVTIQELAEFVIKGCSWAPSVCEGRHNNDNFRFSRLLSMDLDDFYTPEEVRDILLEYGLTWKFFYTTFRDSPAQRKFRVVFDAGKNLDETETLNYLNRLHTIFPKADLSSNRLTQFYFGGKEILFENFDSEPLDYDLLKSTADVEATKDCSKASARTVIDRKMKNKEVPFTPGSKAVYDTITSTVDFDRLADRVMLIKSLRDGVCESTPDYRVGDRLSYPDLFNAVLSMMPFKAGLVQAERWMHKDGRYESKHYKIFNSLRKHSDYAPPLLRKSPFKSDHRYTNSISAYNNSGQGQKIANIIQLAYKLTDAEQLMKEALWHAIKTPGNTVTVIKGATGIGKSRWIKEVFKLMGIPFVYAFPTHKLKDNVVRELGGADSICAAVSPEQPPNLPVEIEQLYNVGANVKAQSEIKKLKTSSLLSPEEKQALIEYGEDNSEVYGTTTLPIFTTHRKALTKNARTNEYPFQHCGTMIFDEDIFSEILPTYHITSSDLMKLQKLVDKNGDKDLAAFVNPIIKYYQDAIQSELPVPLDMLQINQPDKVRLVLNKIVADNASKFEGNILELFRLRGKYRYDTNEMDRIDFAAKKELPSDRKIIILSATADETLYKYLVGEDRLNFIDLSNVETQGQLIQDSSKSCSRWSLDNPATLEYVRQKLEEFGNPQVITFKALQEKFVNPAKGIYFGNCSGSNDLEGHVIAVVGTPHPPQSLVELIASVLGMEVSDGGSCLSPQEVFRNGYRFIFRTYESLNLQAIQFALIEKELIQAIGRARLLRTDAKVYLFSNYLLPDYNDVTTIEVI